MIRIPNEPRVQVQAGRSMERRGNSSHCFVVHKSLMRFLLVYAQANSLGHLKCGNGD